MTLLIALKGNDGLVLAADSRGTFGDPRGVTAQNDSQQKAHILAPHVAVLLAGSAELGSLVLREAVEAIGQGGVDGATAVMNLLRAMARDRYGQWFPSLSAVQVIGQPSRPDLNFIIGGYDPDGAGSFASPVIYQLAGALDFPPMLHDYGFAVAGVPQYALYLLNRLYEPNRSTQELTALAAYAITETASQDGKVGGPVRLITVAPSGCVALDDEAVSGVVARNDERAAALRDSFYERAAR
jgi:20S proteasome alpha/beta subunit